MTLRTSIIAAAAVLALIVPAAAGAREVANLHATVVVKHTTHDLKGTTHKAKSSKAKTGKSSIVTPRYIYVPLPATAPTTYVDPNECQNTGSNCTDQQLCDIWGENCSTPTPIAATPAETSTVETSNGSSSS